MKTGTIEIENMEFYAFHGCYREEQLVGNVFKVNLSMEVDMEAAAESDNVADTVNYLDVYETVRAEMEIKSHILENVAKRILDALARNFPQILTATVKVSKMTPPLGGQIERVSVTQSYSK